MEKQSPCGQDLSRVDETGARNERARNYPGRSVCKLQRRQLGTKEPIECTEVSRGHSNQQIRICCEGLNINARGSLGESKERSENRKSQE